MANLLDLTSQGDVGTITDETKLPSIQLMDPQQLYELWERQNWQSATIDFTQDRSDWMQIEETERNEMLWGLSSFFVGEERVTTQFSGLVMSYADQAEEAFLTTQQVDEARHAQVFNRLYEEVMGIDGTMDSRLERAREDLNEHFIKLFDEELVAVGQQLIDNPGDLEAKVDFVTTYHMIIEGTLALTGQHTITEFFEERGIMPGFIEGFRNISRDEHRHVAYGTWFLQTYAAPDPALSRRVQDKLVELLPVAAGVLAPKGADPLEPWSYLGYTSEYVNGFAFTALSRRLKVIGIGLPAVGAEA